MAAFIAWVIVCAGPRGDGRHHKITGRHSSEGGTVWLRFACLVVRGSS
jgi:hypothetical protein